MPFWEKVIMSAKMRVFGLLVMVLILFAQVPVIGEEDKPEEDHDAKAQKFIDEMNEAECAIDISRAFAKGRTAAPKSVELYKTAVECQLKMGHPTRATAAASALTRLDPDNGMAWGVLAYGYAKRNRFSEAFAMAIMAASKVDDDSGTMNNIGQLLAWYDHQDPKRKLKKDVQKALDENRALWEGDADFDSGFASIEGLFLEHTTEKEETEAEFEEAKDAFELIDEEIRELNEKYRRYDDEFRDLESRNRSERAAFDRLLRSRNPDRSKISRQERDIRSNEDKLKQLERDIEKVRTEFKKIEKDYKPKREAYEKAEKKKETFDKKSKMFRPKFAWLPPAVDGEVVEEPQDKGVKANTPGSGDDDPATEDPGDEDKGENEIKAEKRLKFARLFVANNKTEKAIEICEEIVRLYPKTPSASEAKILLESLQKK